MSYDHYDDFLGGDDEDYGHDPYDYDYYGPNSEFHSSGFHGYGFDDMGDQGEPQETHSPEEPEYKLSDWKRDDPDNYAKIMQVLIDFSLNRNKRMLRKCGESAGPEKLLQVLEADLNAGHCKLMNASIEGVVRTCVYDFDPYTGKYNLSEDN